MKCLMFMAAALLLAPLGTAMAKPSYYVVAVELPGLSQAECLERARPALAAVGFRLGLTSRSEQQAASGDYFGTATCHATGAQVTASITVSGPDTNPVVRLARAVRARIERPHREHPPVPVSPLMQMAAAPSAVQTR